MELTYRLMSKYIGGELRQKGLNDVRVFYGQITEIKFNSKNEVVIKCATMTTDEPDPNDRLPYPTNFTALLILDGDTTYTARFDYDGNLSIHFHPFGIEVTLLEPIS